MNSLILIVASVLGGDNTTATDRLLIGSIANQTADTGKKSGDSVVFESASMAGGSMISAPAMRAESVSLRWRARVGRLWIYNSADFVIARADFFHRLSLEDLYKGGLLRLADWDDQELAKSLFNGNLVGPVFAIVKNTSPSLFPFPLERRVDFVPLNANKVRFFCLYNANLRFSTSNGDMAASVETKRGDCWEKPKWTLNVWDYTGAYSVSSRKWGWRGWSHVDTIEPEFTEDFHVFMKGAEYYFVTESGRLYVSRKPAGGPRKMEPIWVDEKWPVRAIITDADNDRTYLFLRKSGIGETAHQYFELDVKPNPKTIDIKSLRPVKAEGNLGTVLRYAQIIGYSTR